MNAQISVIVPTHNPNTARLRATLLGLRTQTLPAINWETLLIDNASVPALELETLRSVAPSNLRLIREPQLGLSSARRRGFAEARADFAVLVDDDNVLQPDYLETVLSLFEKHPRVGVLGGKSLPQFAISPPPWTAEFHSLLAVRDLGSERLISSGLRPAGATHRQYPDFSPIGAGMGIRREAWSAWLKRPGAAPSDRKGADLSSSGDNDIVLTSLDAGWEVAYFPGLSLTHLIPAERLEPDYLARLNRSMQKSWMRVLTLHDANPWPPLTATGAALRQFKAWCVHRPWSSPAARIRWQGVCGHFDGRTER